MENRIDLDQFRGGTGQYYEGFLPGVYTDGIKYIAEECQCYWLIDLVLSHRNTLPKKLCLQHFPVTVSLEQWSTKQKPDGAKCVVHYHDVRTGEPLQFTLQTVEYTDFPFERFDDGKFSFKMGYDVDTRKLILCLAEED
jgi:hypothetical protein